MAKTEYNDISQEEGVVQKADGGEMNDAGQKDGKNRLNGSIFTL